MLSFEQGDKAVFCGLEAEGPHKGLPTLFIVGTPSGEVVKEAMASFIEQMDTSKGVGLYIGAGGSLVLPTLELVTEYADVVKRSCKQLCSVTIESAIRSILIVQSIEELFLNKFICCYLSWVAPVYWSCPKKLLYMNAVGLDLMKEVARKTRFNCHVKVYVRKMVLMVVPFQYCMFADYDNNVGEYASDKLLYSERKRDA